MATETFEVSLHGGAPWGFRLQGGKEFRAPLLIAKVTVGSKAGKEGVQVGDWLTSINNEPCDDMLHSSALNSIKRTGKDLVLTIERRPSRTAPYSRTTNSLPRPSKFTNGLSSNNSEFKSVQGYATLPRNSGSQIQIDTNNQNHENGFDAADKGGEHRPSSLNTHSSDEFSSRGYGSTFPSNNEWSPDIISNAVRTPQPIRLISPDEPSLAHAGSNTETTRVKSPTSVYGFTDKPAPVGRGARRTNGDETKDSKDNQLLNSGSTHEDEDENGNDSASEQPYRRYSYHGSMMKDQEPKSPEAAERPRIQTGSGWYKELFKEMHTGAGNSTGLSSLLAGDSSPPKNDARGLFKSYRDKSSGHPVARATKSQDTEADPSSSNRFARHSRQSSASDADKTKRHSTSYVASSTATTAHPEVQMREKSTARSNVPSWYKELQQGKEVSEEEIIEDHARQQKGHQVPGGVRGPGDVGPEYPVVRSFSLGPRPSTGPVVHREPPQKMNTNTYQQKNSPDVRQTKSAMRYPATSQNTAAAAPKEPSKPSASNLYEDHLKNRRHISPRPDTKFEESDPVDYIKQFEEEEQRLKEDERRAKEDLERTLREENKAREEAEQKRREIEMRKKEEEEEARRNPKRAKALYNFSPQSAKEIGFRKGDVITFFRTIDENWCEGEAQGNIGLFPTSYVEVLEENAFSAEGEGKVKYNFKAESPRELNLQKGEIVAIIRQIDKNWYEGVKEDKIGIFPVSYIEIIREPSENPPPGSPKKVQEQITKQNGLPEVQSAPLEEPSQKRSYEKQQILNDTVHSNAQNDDISNLDGERFLVVFSYAPQNEDELELGEGDFVKVVEKCDDGWYVGISEKSGDFGTFPGNYVRKLT